jgi:hypothetical protein
MDDLERHWKLVKQTKLKQNARRAKAGKPPMWPSLIRAEAKKEKASKAKKPPAPESGDEDDTALSFEEWKDSGWSVREGEKAKIFSIEGIPQFTRDQVRKINPAWKFTKR